jgi:hypothetical protein
MGFFFRSDNLPFARRGIPAHTLSSYEMHADYHTPDDEVERVDFAHLTALVDHAEGMVRTLAAGPAPTWRRLGGDASALGLRGPFPLRCPDGGVGFALFVEGPPGEAWLTLAGERHLLAQVEAANGARYQRDGVVLWLEGSEARVEMAGGEPRACRLDEPTG